MMIRIFTDPQHAPASDWRNHLILILKAHWGDGTDWDRDSIAYLRADFALTDDITAADIVALPLSWNYYVARGKIDLARALAAQAARAGKWIAVWSEGDHHARLPFENALLFQYDLRRSRRRDERRHIYEYARSPFTLDYPALYLNGQIAVREKSAKPLIGFCGHAQTSDAWKIRARNVYRHLQARLKTVYFDPPPLRLAVDFRAAILRRLTTSPHVETNFIIRDDYGGKQHNTDAVREYVENLRDTDYTVCMRGWGNYSIRFCETLSMGRIPIFIDTDCALPYDFKLDWKQYVVWVDERDLDHIGERVADFHARLSPGDFVALQHECRRVWTDYLTQATYYRQFGAHLQHAGIPVSAS